jgi:hypothetical protein
VERISEVQEAENRTDATLEEVRTELAEIRQALSTLVVGERGSGMESSEEGA